MKKIALFFALSLPLTLAAQQYRQKADDAYSKGNFTEALQQYEQALSSSNGEDAYYARLRIIDCQYKLGQYAAALQSAFAPLPTDPLWQARFLLYRVQTAQTASKVYSAQMSPSDAADDTDLTSLSPAQWQHKIDTSFEDLWALRKNLINAPIENESLIINAKDADVQSVPTLFDFVVQQWQQHLKQKEISPLRTQEVLTLDFKAPKTLPSADNEKLAAILAEAATLGGKNRSNARLIWTAQRLQLPTKDTSSTQDQQENTFQAARLLQTLSGYDTNNKGFFKKITDALRQASTDYGKAYAAYAAAQLWQQTQEYEAAVSLCDWAGQALTDSPYTQSCSNLAENIRRPILDIRYAPFNQDPQHTQFRLHTRNTAQVYARLYKITEKQLLSWSDEKNPSSWRYLTRIPASKTPLLLAQTPLAEWDQQVVYNKPYAFASFTLPLPELTEKGFYALALSYNKSFDTNTTPVKTVVFSYSDLALFGSAAIEADPQDFLTGKDKTVTPKSLFRFFTVNLKTGQPEPETRLTYRLRRNDAFVQTKTDKDGFFATKPTIHTRKNFNQHIIAKADKNGSIAPINDLYFHYNPAQLIHLYVETDRAIYRPGQKVQIAVYGLENAGRGLRTLPPNTPVSLELIDPNGQIFYRTTLPLNSFGSAQTEIVLPQDNLLGRYGIHLFLANEQDFYSTSYFFKVDEYKRPDYEVSLEEAALQYGKEASISGKAQYYFGAPMEKAEVSYTVRRRYYHPPFWWWRGLNTYAYENTLVAQGTVNTDKTGTFKIAFTPQTAPEANQPCLFEVKVSVKDASGRVIENTRSYKVSAKNLFFQASFTKGFYDAHVSGPLAEVKLGDLNGVSQPGKFTAEIYQLENHLPVQDPKLEVDSGEFSIVPPSRNSQLDEWYGNNKVLSKVLTQVFTIKKDESVQLILPALPEGIYKLKLSAKNADDAELVFLVAAEKSNLALPPVAIAQYTKYYPGNEAKFLIGAQKLKGWKFIEVYQESDFLVARFAENQPGVHIFHLPVQAAWRGGIGMHWVGASDYHIYYESATIAIPWDNKALTLQMDIPDTVQPGQTVRWPLQVTDASGTPVNAQASVRVYDKSLDYYAAIEPLFSLNKVYPENTARYRWMTNSMHDTSSTDYFNGEYPRQTYPNFLSMPQLNLLTRFRRYGNVLTANAAAAPRMMKQAASRAMGTDDAVTMDMAEAGAFSAGIAESSYDSPRSFGAGIEFDDMETQTESPRTDFSEMAYFNALLPITNGKAEAKFTLPQSLTGWKVMAFALTKNVDLGTFSAQTVTRKDLSVRLSLPRFWRENDHSTLVAQVTNVTGKKRTAEVTLDILLDGQNAAQKLGIEKNTQTLTLPANGTTAATWPITLPQGVGILEITATVRSGQESDAETRSLPLLPAAARVAESVTVALESGSQTLKLDNLLTQDDSRRVNSVTLRVDPSLLLSVFNSMPQLLVPTYHDALSVAGQFLPLAVVNGLYKKYPMLQDAVSSLPKRNTQTPVWDEKDPSRLLLLSQTPWLRQAGGRKQTEALITDLFNPSAVAKARTQAEKDLAKYQTANGGYSWMPGGKPSEFITLRILASYAQALRYGADIPQDAAKKALAWLGPRIEENLLKQSAANAGTVAHALYAAYVFTAFPQNWKEIQKTPVKKWLDYAAQHAEAMTPLGQTYAAAAYYRLGDNTKAQSMLEVVLSQLKTDPVTGAYFAPEAQSWLWYNDTLFTQTATLRTLLEIRPESDKATELVKWLLFNRKAQSWRSSAETAEAIYALLDYMQRHGLVDDPADYTVQWGPVKESLHFEPFEWNEPLSWTQTAENVPTPYYTAQVTKYGGLTGFASLDTVYTTANVAASPEGILNVTREYLLKYTEDGREKVRPLQAGELVPVGSEIEVKLTVNAHSAFDYVLLSDPKPAGFENTQLISGWTWDTLSIYREYRDAATNFFIDRLPAGTYTLRYSLRPTLAGVYHALPAQLQSMYAPEFSAHTAAEKLDVK